MKKKTLGSVLKKLLVILIIILVSLISFLGIHKKELNSWKNILPDYELSKELSNVRIFGFTVDDSTEEQEVESEETSDEETNEEEIVEQEEEVVDEETTETEEHEHIEVPVNDPSILTKDNYRKSKSIVEKRLKNFGITDATVTVNEETGDLSVSVPYSTITDYTVSLAGNQGKLEIIDTDTEEVLIPRSMIKKVSAYYNQSSTDTTDSEYMTYDIGIQIEFTSEGLKKLSEITKTYIQTYDEEGTATQKTVTIRLDGEDKYITYFAADGNYQLLTIPLYASITTEDMDLFNQYYNECIVIQTEVNTDEMPIIYTLTTGTYIDSNLGENFIRNSVIAIIVVLCIVGIYMIIKYKLKGLSIVLIEIGFVAIHTLLIRAASVSLTLSGLVMIPFMALVNYYLLTQLVNKENVMEQLETFGKFILELIPFIIAIIVFVLSKSIELQSVGMVAVWAIFVFAYTLITSMILLRKTNTDKNGVEK